MLSVTCLKKWLNIAVVTIMLMSLVTPAVGAQNVTNATTTEDVVENLLSELDESNETAIDENTQRVISLIDAIPSIEQLNETNHLLVQEARAAYEKLTDEQKKNVTNLQALVEKENALQALSDVSNPAGYVYFSIEDFAERVEYTDFPEPLGTIIERARVPFYDGDTIADVTVRALEEKGITPVYSGTTKEGFYLSSIENFTHNGEVIDKFGEFSAGYMSGWMITLNDWFINMGASEFLVTEGDTISWQYSGNMGEDIGADWMNTSAKITGLNIVGNAGQLSPEFDTEVKSYTLTVPKNIKAIQLKAEANKMSRVQYYVGNVEYKLFNDIPVNNGTVITIKSKFEDTMSGITDTDEITVKVVSEKVTTDKSELQSTITDAEANKATVAVSTDGKDIDSANFWVTQSELDTYVAAITTAQALMADEAATQEEIDAKTLALNQATATFNNAKKAGLKVVEQLTTEKAYNTASRYLVQLTPNPKFGNEWVIFALARGGYEVPVGYYDTYYNNVVDYVQSVNGKLHTHKYTEYSRLIIALTAIGKDPRNVGGYNIVEKLYDFDNVVWQGVNGAYFGLIALDTWGFELPESATTTRQKLIDHILSKQLTDGGFALSGKTLDPDMTAMAIQALAPYGNKANVKAAIDRAVEALETAQKANGGYASWGVESAESVAQVITALVSINIDPMQDERFNKTVSNLLSFYSETDGGFKHALSETKANGMATEQASYTLAAYKRLLNGQTALYNMLDTKPADPTPDEPEKPNPGETEKPTPDETEKPKPEKPYGYSTFSIVISSSEVPLAPITTEIFEGESVFDVLKRVTAENDISLSYRTTGYGIYVDGINGLYEFDRGPESGWMYRVNGVFPSHSAALHILQPGDRVEWLYTTNLGADIGGNIEADKNEPGQPEQDKEDDKNEPGQPEQDKEDDKIVIEVDSKEGTTENTFTADDIKQFAQSNIKTIVIQDKHGTKLEIPTSILSSIHLAADEKIITAVTVQAEGKKIDVNLSIEKADGTTKAISTGKDYVKITLPASDVTANTVVLQSVNGEYKAVPHKIVDGKIIILTKTSGTFVLTEETVTFKDITETFNKDEIEFLASRHIIKGVNADEFAPNKAITRAQFAVMISRALGLQASEENPFSDTKGKWYEQEVQALFEAGITTGKTADTFDPESNITRQQAAAFMARVLAYVNFQAQSSTEAKFNDANTISPEFKQYIDLLNSLNIMTGKEDGTFDPCSSLTRAQMAKILKRTLNVADLM